MKIVNDVQARNAPEGRHNAAPNLYLIVGAGRAWELLFTSPSTGKRRSMGLGPYPTVSLADARAKANEARVMIAKGQDPIEARRAAAAPRGLPSFATVAAEWFEVHGSAWPGDYLADRKAEMQRVTQAFASKPIAEVTRNDVAAAVKAARDRTPAVARRVRAQIEKVFDFAIARELVASLNPALKGPLEQLIGRGAHETEHRSAMPYDQVPAFYARLRASGYVAAPALALLILTGMRRDEVREMTWGEVDLDKRLWTVPAERMKGGEERIVPLSEAAIEILREAQRRQLQLAQRARRCGWGDYVFHGRDNSRLSAGIMLETMGRISGGDGFTVHGFRSALRGWAHRETSHPYAICEEALSHAYGSQVERAYRRGQAVEKVRALLDDWASFVTRAPADNVIPLRRIS